MDDGSGSVELSWSVQSIIIVMELGRQERGNKAQMTVRMVMMMTTVWERVSLCHYPCHWHCFKMSLTWAMSSFTSLVHLFPSLPFITPDGRHWLVKSAYLLDRDDRPYQGDTHIWYSITHRIYWILIDWGMSSLFLLEDGTSSITMTVMSALNLNLPISSSSGVII